MTSVAPITAFSATTVAIHKKVNAAKVTTDVMPIHLDMHYKGDETTQIVSKALGIAYSPNWSVVAEDSENKLALSHYSLTANMKEYGHIRGNIIDTELGIVLANSFGYTPTVLLNSTQQLTKFFTVQDNEGVMHTFDLEKATIKRAFQGVVLRALWHKGKFFLITLKKLESSRSRWGSSKYFVTIYEEAGGPTADQLFDTSKPFTDTCYDFLVVDATLIVGSRQRVNKPYLVLLAERKYDSQRPADQVAPARRNFMTSKAMEGLVNESFIHDPQSLSLEDANGHLRYGYYDTLEYEDPRMGTGEELIIYSQDEHGTILDIIKVAAADYKYRNAMRADNPNIAHQFYSSLDSCYDEVTDHANWTAFKKHFIMFPLYDIDSVQTLLDQTGGVIALPINKDPKYTDYLNRDDRIHMLFLNYFITLPIMCQQQAIDMYIEYLRDRDDLIKWLAVLEAEHKGKHKNQLDQLELHKRVISLILAVRDLTDKDIKAGRTVNRKGVAMQRNTLIKSKIANLILKERGTSLYSLVREMKRARDPKPVAAVEDTVSTVAVAQQ